MWRTRPASRGRNRRSRARLKSSGVQSEQSLAFWKQSDSETLSLPLRVPSRPHVASDASATLASVFAWKFLGLSFLLHLF